MQTTNIELPTVVTRAEWLILRQELPGNGAVAAGRAHRLPAVGQISGPILWDVHAAGNRVTRDEFIASFKETTLLKRLSSLADVGNVAVLMASDYAGSMTGMVANMNCGQIVD
jgi:enoyl-[acyl-carrier-protein] reductase (NADH)